MARSQHHELQVDRLRAAYGCSRSEAYHKYAEGERVEEPTLQRGISTGHGIHTVLDEEGLDLGLEISDHLCDED